MPIVEFEGGQRVEFDRTPSQEDIEEAASQLNLQPSVSVPEQPKRRFQPVRIAEPKRPTLEEIQQIGGQAIGFGPGILGSSRQFLQRGIQEGVRKTAPLAERLLTRALGTPSKVIEAGRAPAKQLLQERRFFGTGQKLLSKLQGIRAEVRPKIESALAEVKELTTVESTVQKVVDKYKKQGIELTTDEVKEVLSKQRPLKDLIGKVGLTFTEKNRLRMNADQILGEGAFISGVTGFERKILKDFSNFAREEIKTGVPTTRRLFQRESAAITGFKSLKSKLAKEGSKALPFLTLGGPSAIGFATGKEQEGIAAGVALEAIRKGRRDPLVLSTMAKLLNQVQGKVTPEKVSQILQKVAGGILQK